MIQVVRIAAIVSSVGLAAALLAGCGGSGSSGAASVTTTSREAVEGLRTLVVISPEATGWAWPVKPKTRVGAPASSFTMDPSEPSYSIQKDVNDAYIAAGVRQYATSSWLDATLKKASSFANLVSTRAGAESAMNAEREFAHTLVPQIRRNPDRRVQRRRDWPAQLGCSGQNDQRGFAEIGWTRGNLCSRSTSPASPARRGRGWRPTLGRDDRSRSIR